MIFTSKGTIAKQFCGHSEKKWCLFQHNTGKCLEVFADFESCIHFVYPPVVRYTRQPTASEVRFGEGCIHWRDFDPMKCIKPNGELKQWFKCKDDGLRYYRH